MQLDSSPLNSPVRIIIKKENIGLHEHQHQRYQYHLFNNNEKRDQIYDDLSKMKDRLVKALPNMQQVIHRDIKRAYRNQIHERKLVQDLNGPRGLKWQYKHRMQRLENDEREIERDLIRLRHDRMRASLFSLSNRESSSRPSTHLIRSRTPGSSIPVDAHVQRSSRTKSSFNRPLSVNPNRTPIDRFIPLECKRLSCANNGWTSFLIHIFTFPLLLILLRFCLIETKNASAVVLRIVSLYNRMSFIVASVYCYRI